jgi:hypothetical protein
MKFASLTNVLDWKRARGESKDQVDIALIDAWVAKHPLMQIDTSARLTVLRFRNSWNLMYRKIIRSLKKSSLNTLRWRIIKSIKGTR